MSKETSNSKWGKNQQDFFDNSIVALIPADLS